MNRKKRRGGLVLLFLVVLSVPPAWMVYRNLRQEGRDHALIAAIKAENNEQILALLAEGASGEARDTGKPPTIQEALLRTWNHFRHPGTASVAQAANEEHLPALLVLYHQADGPHPYGVTPQLAVVRALLDHGARVSDRDRDGATPLHHAARFSNSDIVRLLLVRGADRDAKDKDGETPLLGASAAGAKVLLEQGADIEAMTRFQH